LRRPNVADDAFMRAAKPERLGFVSKDATLDESVAAIRSVAAGDKVLPPSITESLFSHSRGVPTHPFVR
jgi:DNA-binding NarL/FixJ family response regulator